MTDDNFDAHADARDGTIELVSAYVSNSNTRLSTQDLQALIRETYATLSSLQDAQGESKPEEAAVEAPTRAEIKRSIGTEHLVSFEDGRPYKSLKRHLTSRSMTPDDYRAKWSLPVDYPMVHPTCNAERSALAKAIGLGAKGRSTKAVPADAPKAPRKPRASKAAA